MYNHRDDWENRFRLRYALDEPEADGTVEGAILRQTKGGGPDVDFARLEDQRVVSFQGGGEHLAGARLRIDWSLGYAKASEDRPDERYVEWQASDVLLREDISDPSKPNFTAVSAAD